MINVNKASVLVVDDSAVDYKLSSRWLDRCEWVEAVEWVRSGREVLERLQSSDSCAAIDLVLLDLHLRDMTGLEVLAELQSLEAALPLIVVLSGTVSEKIEAEAVDMGAVCCLGKPWDAAGFDDLMGSLNQLWRDHSAT